METQNNVRIKMLKIWELLCQETDEEHPMETTTILQKLKEMGIVCDRRTLYSDIKILNACGYEIFCKRAKNNEYYVVDRKFDIPELRILLDAVQAASFITEKKTEEFVDKLATLAGSRKGEVLKQNIVAFNTTKSTNEAIYYSVNEIALAINNHKRIEFYYFDYDTAHNKVYRKDKKKYKVNPYATIFSNDCYYLACYHGRYDNIVHYRIDRMDGVKMIDEPIPEVEGIKKFDIKAHKKQIFSMYGGEVTTVTFKADKSLIDTVYDKFGDKLKIYPIDENTIGFSAEVQVSPMFIGWCCAFGSRMKATSPPSVIEEISKHIEALSNTYKSE